MRIATSFIPCSSNLMRTLQNTWIKTRRNKRLKNGSWQDNLWAFLTEVKSTKAISFQYFGLNTLIFTSYSHTTYPNFQPNVIDREFYNCCFSINIHPTQSYLSNLIEPNQTLSNVWLRWIGQFFCEFDCVRLPNSIEANQPNHVFVFD